MRNAILVLTLLGASAGARASLINGGFDTGDLTGWTPYNTINGGTAISDVVPFDTAGTGSPSPSFSAQLRVGETGGTIGGGGVGEGAGIQQSVSLLNGTLNLSVNVATTTNSLNADGGTFELLLDGNVVAIHSFGAINVPVERDTLSFSGLVTEGTHIIGVEARRGFGIGVPNTPIQYFDNVDISGSAVPLPEPSSAMMGLIAAAGMLGMRRRQRA